MELLLISYGPFGSCFVRVRFLWFSVLKFLDFFCSIIFPEASEISLTCLIWCVCEAIVRMEGLISWICASTGGIVADLELVGVKYESLGDAAAQRFRRLRRNEGPLRRCGPKAPRVLP